MDWLFPHCVVRLIGWGILPTPAFFQLKDPSEVTLPEKVVQASGLKDQSLASGSMVKKEPVYTSHAQQPLGKQNEKSPCSGSVPRPAK